MVCWNFLIYFQIITFVTGLHTSIIGVFLLICIADGKINEKSQVEVRAVFLKCEPDVSSNFYFTKYIIMISLFRKIRMNTSIQTSYYMTASVSHKQRPRHGKSIFICFNIGVYSVPGMEYTTAPWRTGLS